MNEPLCSKGRFGDFSRKENREMVEECGEEKKTPVDSSGIPQRRTIPLSLGPKHERKYEITRACCMEKLPYTVERSIKFQPSIRRRP